MCTPLETHTGIMQFVLAALCGFARRGPEGGLRLVVGEAVGNGGGQLHGGDVDKVGAGVLPRGGVGGEPHGVLRSLETGHGHQVRRNGVKDAEDPVGFPRNVGRHETRVQGGGDDIGVPPRQRAGVVDIGQLAVRVRLERLGRGQLRPTDAAVLREGRGDGDERVGVGRHEHDTAVIAPRQRVHEKITKKEGAVVVDAHNER
mmetsp:Transcript_33034/g.92490  ORF Transcript_33034/g.92490 Transcript_33034/m.92490 type:complete len:202 (-) Transcript_33034:484-1089(-)